MACKACVEAKIALLEKIRDALERNQDKKLSEITDKDRIVISGGRPKRDPVKKKYIWRGIKPKYKLISVCKNIDKLRTEINLPPIYSDLYQNQQVDN